MTEPAAVRGQGQEPQRRAAVTMRIPVAEWPKPRKVEITAGTDAQPTISTSG
jgi:hypothetical protein